VARFVARTTDLGSILGSAVIFLSVVCSAATAQTVDIRVIVGSDGDGTVTSSPAGIACTVIDQSQTTGTCSASFPVGTVVTLTATPAQYNSFGGWSSPSSCGTTPTCQVTESQNVVARFIPQTFPLTIVGAGNAGGLIYGDRALGFLGQDGLACQILLDTASGDCVTQYPVNKRIRIDFRTSADGAIGVPNLSAPCTNGFTCGGIMPPGPLTITATFRGPGFQVSGAGAGSGRVTTSNGLIDCTVAAGAATGTCQELYLRRTPSTVTLTAVPAPGSRFVGFSGVCTSTTTTCQFLPTTPPGVPTSLPAVTATFALESVPLSVSGAGSGAGTVMSNPAGMNCAIAAGSATGACTASFVGGTAVTLQATPNAGSVFTGWAGACSGTGSCSVTLNTAQSVTAQFAAITPTVAVTGTGSGSVSSSPAGLACTLTSGATSGTCSASFTYGNTVTLTTTPASGWVFSGWGGDCTGTGTCQPNVTANRAVVANFVRATIALKITGAGTGDGIVKAPSVGLNCPVSKGGGKEADCTVLVAQDVAVTLTADPQGGSVFAGWSGDVCTGTALTCTLTVSQARNVVAQFRAPKPGRDVAQSMLGGAALAADEIGELDRFGNKDGKLNIGDLLALLDRTGERLTTATTQALIEADRRASSQTPASSTRRKP
jgi:hypothetical protein